MVDYIGQRIIDEEHILIGGLSSIFHVLYHLIGSSSVNVYWPAILHPGDICSWRTS